MFHDLILSNSEVSGKPGAVQGKRLTRFRITHSIEGLNELLRRAGMVRVNHGGGGKPVFAFEATGHVWEAVAHYLQEHGQRYVLFNPLATFRVREARQMGREKTDITDAGQIAELVRGGLVTGLSLTIPSTTSCVLPGAGGYGGTTHSSPPPGQT